MNNFLTNSYSIYKVQKAIANSNILLSARNTTPQAMYVLYNKSKKKSTDYPVTI